MSRCLRHAGHTQRRRARPVAGKIRAQLDLCLEEVRAYDTSVINKDVTNNDVLIRHAWVVTQDASRHQAKLDVRVRAGRVVEIAPTLPVGDEPVCEARGMWLIPGLVQSHIHLTQTLFRGLADDRELLPWLRDRIWPLEAAHTEATNRVSAELGIAELLLSGTTTILDMGTTRHHDVVFETAEAMGIGYIGGKAMMDQGEGAPASLLETTEASLASSDALRERWHLRDAGRLRYAYAPRFILSCSDALLKGVAERSQKHDCLIHTHANENRGEYAAVTALVGQPNLAALASRGCLTERSVVAHSVWVDGDEEETLVRSGAAVCHCPGSNLKLASGLMPLVRLRERGVRIGIGADGAACNNTLDAFFELRLAALLPRLGGGPASISAQAIFDLATIDGARALHMEQEIGSIELGKRADLVLLAPGLGAIPFEGDVVSPLVFAAHGGWVREVFVAGRQVVERGTLRGVDLDALSSRVSKARAEVATAILK